MNHSKLLPALCAFTLLLGGCTPAHSQADASAPGTTLADWEGSYRGTLPCADCEGIDTVVILRGDGSYLHQARYLGKAAELVEHQGPIRWSADGNSIILGSGGNDVYYQQNHADLEMLDQQGERITGALAQRYILTRQPPASLTETHWKLVELMGKPIGKSMSPPNITLSEDKNRFHGSGGCNRIMGGYTIEKPNRLRFTEAASTMMACLNSMELEREFLDTLSKVDSYSIHGAQLQLLRARMAPLARFEAVYLQ